jgi:colicin import membrane protein
MENTALSLENLKVSNIPELLGWKEKQEILVKENPFVEITDNKTYDLACKSRTALLKGRTSLEGQDKVIASTLAGFRKEVKSETDKLVAITLPHEEKQQIEVKRYEGIKENERIERDRLENERISGIKSKIEAIESDCFEIIQTMVYDGIVKDSDSIAKICKSEFDFEEYEILFHSAILRVENSLKDKIDALGEKEAQRLENERLKVENDAAIAKAKELQDKIDADKKEYERKAKEVQDKIDAENLEREKKYELEKEQVFEIRKNRLEKVGFTFFENVKRFELIEFGKVFYFEESEIKESDVIDFETLLTDVELSVENAKSEFEKSEKLKEENEQKAKDAADKFKADADAFAEKQEKENKDRIARFLSDKKLLNDFVECLEFGGVIPDCENNISEEYLSTLFVKLADFKKNLLIEITNI